MNCLKIFSIALAAGLLSISCDKKNDGEENPGTTKSGIYTGTLTVGTENPFTLEDREVEFTVDKEDENAGQIEMFKVKFASGMPVEIDMTIPGVAVAYFVSGECTLSGDEIIPIAMGGPNPQYTITDLEGSVDETGENLSFSFTCKNLTVNFTGTRAE
jgi:hypothetical protein